MHKTQQLQRDQDDVIDLLGLFHALIRKIWIVLLCMLLAGAATFGATYFFVEPEYQASVLFYVNNSSISIGGATVSFSGAEISAARSLADTYMVLLTSIPTVESVIEEAGVDYTYEQLSSMITSSTINNTEIFRATVTASDPYEAQLLANTIADVLPERIAEVVDGSAVRVVQHAKLPTVRSAPNYTQYVILACCFGAIVSIFVLVVYYFRKGSIQSEDYLKQAYPNIPLLAVIPDASSSRSDRAYRYYKYADRDRLKDRAPGAGSTGKPGNAGAEAAAGKSRKDTLIPAAGYRTSEAYKLLRASMAFTFSSEDQGHIVGITSSFRHEGKTTVAINTSYRLAESGKRTLLIDADLRMSELAKLLQLKETPGLSNLLAGMNMVNEALQTYSAAVDDDKAVSMDVLVAGSVPPNPNELLGSDRMARLLALLRERYEYIIVDLPPTLEASDSMVVSSVVDGMMLVVGNEIATRYSVTETLRQLRLVDCRVAGFVYNCGGSAAGKSRRATRRDRRSRKADKG